MFAQGYVLISEGLVTLKFQQGGNFTSEVGKTVDRRMRHLDIPEDVSPAPYVRQHRDPSEYEFKGEEV